MWQFEHALVNALMASPNALASLSSAALAIAFDCSAYCLVSFSHDAASPFGHFVLGRFAQHSVSVLASFWASSQFALLPASAHLAHSPFSALVLATVFMISLIDGVFSSAAAVPRIGTSAITPASAIPAFRSMWASPRTTYC